MVGKVRQCLFVCLVPMFRLNSQAFAHTFLTVEDNEDETVTVNVKFSPVLLPPWSRCALRMKKAKYFERGKWMIRVNAFKKSLVPTPLSWILNRDSDIKQWRKYSDKNIKYQWLVSTYQ